MSVDGDEAHLDLDASDRAVSEDGKRRAEASLSGPVRARREGGDWKVVDYCIDGRLISDAFTTLAGEPVESSGLRLRMHAVWLDRRWTYAFVEVEQAEDRRTKAEHVSLKVGRSWCAGRWTPPTLKPTRRQWLLLRFRKSLPFGPEPFIVRLGVKGSGARRTDVIWLVDVGRGVAEGRSMEVSRPRAVARSAPVAWVVGGGLFAGYVVAYGVPSVFFFVTTALLFGGFYLYGRSRR